MANKENGKSEVTQPDDIANGAGWLFRKIQEGWLRKRWRKRWCLVRDGKLYFFEYNTSDYNDKNCGVIDLSMYENCVRGTKKEAEKKANLIVLETLKNKPGQKNKVKAHREMFCTETSDVMEQWFEKLNEAIAVARMGGDTKLTHVTKLRAKPAATKRRPPSRSHLKERALTSGLDIEEGPSVPLEKKKRGHVPSSAIKPPPSSFKVKSPEVSEDPLPPLAEDLPPPDDLPSPLDVSEDKTPNFEDTGLPSPPSNGEFPFSDTKDEDLTMKDGESPGAKDDLPSPIPPPPPSKVLKPKLEGKNSRPPSPLVPKEMLDRCSPTSSRGNSPSGSVRSLNTSGSAEIESLSAHGSFKRDNFDQRAELLKTKVVQTLKSSEGNSNLTQQHRSRSMAYLDDLDNDLPPPPELPEGYTEDENSVVVKKGKKDKKKKKKRPMSLIFN